MDLLVKPIASISCLIPPDYVNEEARVECDCDCKDGNPSPRASWLKDGKEIVSRKLKKATLLIENVKIEHAGTYKCFCESYDQRTEKEIHIIVRCKYTM